MLCIEPSRSDTLAAKSIAENPAQSAIFFKLADVRCGRATDM